MLLLQKLLELDLSPGAMEMPSTIVEGLSRDRRKETSNEATGADCFSTATAWFLCDRSLRVDGELDSNVERLENCYGICRAVSYRGMSFILL